MKNISADIGKHRAKCDFQRQQLISKINLESNADPQVVDGCFVSLHSRIKFEKKGYDGPVTEKIVELRVCQTNMPSAHCHSLSSVVIKILARKFRTRQDGQLLLKFILAHLSPKLTPLGRTLRVRSRLPGPMLTLLLHQQYPTFSKI